MSTKQVLVISSGWFLVFVLMLGSYGCVSGTSNESILSSFLDPLTPPTPAEMASDLFNMYDADRRRRAVTMFSASPFGGDESYVKTYRLLLDDVDPTVRGAAAKALGLHGSVDDAILVAGLLREEPVFVRWEATQALQKIHNSKVVAPLARVLKGDQDSDVRMAAARALGQYPKRPVFDALVGSLLDESFGVIASSRNSLKTLTGQDLGLDPARWLNWADQQGANLFGDQEPYTFEPYVEPPGVLDKMQFWKESEEIPPQAPTGLDNAVTPFSTPTS